MSKQTRSTQPFPLPDSWEAMPYGEHWSFAYKTEHGERQDYDFRVEFDQSVNDIEEGAIIGLLEAAPRLLAALQALAATARTFRNVPENEQQWTSIDDAALDAAFAAIAEATGRAS